VTDIPQPAPGDTSWTDWATETEEQTDAVRLKASNAWVEYIMFHDGSAGGGSRPTGFARVRWVGGASRPTNMAANDVWEHDV
jgi:hypothetical protein